MTNNTSANRPEGTTDSKMTNKSKATTEANKATSATPAEIARNIETMAKADSVPAPTDVTLRPARNIPGFALPEKMVDVRGFKVLASDGQEVGTVDGLMVDSKGNEVRWLAVGLNEKLRTDAKSKETAVLVPAGRVEHMADKKTVTLKAIGSDQLMQVPKVMPGSPVTRKLEDETLTVLGIPSSKDMPKGALYSGAAFDTRMGLQTTA